MEQRIRDLCAQLLATENPQAVIDLSRDLQCAIHEHIESIRKKLLEVPASTAAFDMPGK